MNRRNFLKSAMALSAMTNLPSSTTAAEPAPRAAGRRVKIGFLGASHSHAAEKVRIAQTWDTYEFVGICDGSEAVHRRYQNSGARFVSLEQLLSEAEIVAVESDVKDHARHAKIALEAGKHVHLEKPAADTLEAGQELFRLARKKGRLLQIGYMWRFHPGLNAMLEAARQGWLGEVYLVRGAINTHIPANQRPGWAPFPGGTLFELGCHLIDPLVRLLGRPKNVTPTIRKHGRFEDDLRDNTVAVFEFERALGIISSATLQPDAGSHRVFEVLGTNGTARLSPIEPPMLKIQLAKAAGPYRAGTQDVELPPYRRYAPEMKELAEAVLLQRPLSVTLDEETLVQETLLRACGMV